MTEMLLTMEEVARRLGGGKPIPLSTLYAILKRIEVDNPNVVFSRKVGRARMFTERDYQFIVEQLGWRAARVLQQDRPPTEARSVDDALGSLRGADTKRLAAATVPGSPPSPEEVQKAKNALRARRTRESKRLAAKVRRDLNLGR